MLAIVHLRWHSWLSHGGQRQHVLIRESGGFELDDLRCLFLQCLLTCYRRTTHSLQPQSWNFDRSSNDCVYVNCRPVPSRLDFSVTLSCELPAQMLLSRLLVAVSQVSGGGFVEPEASVLLMIVFVERMCARLSNVESWSVEKGCTKYSSRVDLGLDWCSQHLN